MKHFVIALFLFFCACDDSISVECINNNLSIIKPIWVDPGCEDTARQSIVRAVETLNELGQQQVCGPLVELVGESDNQNRVICYYTPVSTTHSTTIGFADLNHMDLYLWRMPDSVHWIESLVLHELMHYIGIEGHTDDFGESYAVMSSGIDNLVQFTSVDIELFCEFFDCVNR